MHGSARITRPRQADGLHVDHWVGGAGHGLLQVAGTLWRQRQTGIAVERRQLQRRFATAGLGLAAVDIDRIDQLRLFAGGSQCPGRDDQAQRQGGNG